MQGRGVVTSCILFEYGVYGIHTRHMVWITSWVMVTGHGSRFYGLRVHGNQWRSRAMLHETIDCIYTYLYLIEMENNTNYSLLSLLGYFVLSLSFFSFFFLTSFIIYFAFLSFAFPSFPPLSQSPYIHPSRNTETEKTTPCETLWAIPPFHLESQFGKVQSMVLPYF